MRTVTRRILLSGTMAAAVGPMIIGRATAEERVGLRSQRWAADTWRSLVAMTDERTGLTADNIDGDLDPGSPAPVPGQPLLRHLAHLFGRLRLGLAAAAAGRHHPALSRHQRVRGRLPHLFVPEARWAPRSWGVNHPLARRYLSLDQAMIMGALGNRLADDVIRRAFCGREVTAMIKPLIGMETFGAGLD